ncbi:MAG: DUF192 domain-containing protein [Haloarculaceae archaeon]
MTPQDTISRRRCLKRAVAALGGMALAGCVVGSDPAQTATSTDTAVSTATAGDGGVSTQTRVTQAETPADGRAATPTEGTPIHPGYGTTEVRVHSPEGQRLGAVTAAVADTPSLRYRGLSDTGSLPADRGMLFVYESVDVRAFVMREMEFGIDIVFADDRRTITTIHHAPAPGPGEDGADQRYAGRGQYVLEVPLGWTTDRGIEPGDVLAFEEEFAP